MKEDTLRQTTNYIKGIAILAVLINHYLNKYTSINSMDYASSILCFFFILGGYGLFYSLEKRFKNSEKDYSFKKIGSFYLDRFLRIIPLYILAIILISLLSLFEDPKIIFPIYWFINAILICYLFSFPIYYLPSNWS